MSRVRSVLIVEEHAHRTDGHFPTRFLELADGYEALGVRVEILTARGSAPRAGPRSVHQFGPAASTLARAAAWLRRPHFGTGDTSLQRLGHALGMVATMSAVSSLRRRKDPPPDAIVILGWNTNPSIVAALAEPGNWLLHQFRAPEHAPRWRISAMNRITTSIAHRRVERIRRAGGRIRLASSDDRWRRSWSEEVPFLDPTTLPIAGVRPEERVPGAREVFGIPHDAKVALVFGAGATTDVDTVLQAFGDTQRWRLVIAGAVARGLDPAEVPESTTIVANDVVDNATRDQLFSAVDLVVLSFWPDSWNDSGVLMDAISAGLPVVCSDRSFAANVVREYGLGAVFAPSDAASLRASLGTASKQFDHAGLRRARVDRSNASVARDQLAALGLTVDG